MLFDFVWSAFATFTGRKGLRRFLNITVIRSAICLSFGKLFYSLRMGDKARNQSTKYPCGTCNLECKDGSVSGFKRGCSYHACDCSGVAANVLRCLQNTSGLIWLCKNCKDSGKDRVSGNRSKERGRKSESVLRSTYKLFGWDRNNSDRNFYNVVRCVHIPLVP